MESYKIYKSLPLEDFEDCFAFVMATGTLGRLISLLS